MQLKYKIPLVLFIAYVVVVGLVETVTMVSTYRLNREARYETATAYSRERSSTVEGYMDFRILQLKSLETAVLALNGLNDQVKTTSLEKILNVLALESVGNGDVSAVSNVSAVFERGAVFSANLTKPGEYYNIGVFRPLKGAIRTDIARSYVLAEEEEWYHVPRNTGKIHLTEPYKWKYPGENEERLIVTLSKPVFVDGNFVGVVGMDLELDKLSKELLYEVKSTKSESYMILVSNAGLRVMHPNRANLLVPIGNDLSSVEQKSLLESIRKGKEHLIVKKSLETGKVSLLPFVPIIVKDLELPWSVAYITSLEALQREELKTRKITLSVLIGSVLVWIGILVLLMQKVFGSMTNAIRVTQEESKNLLEASLLVSEISSKLAESSLLALEQSEKAFKLTKETGDNFNSIANDTDWVSANTNQLASTAQQVRLNMNSVAGAVEEMSSSFAHITDDANASKKIAADAMEKSAEATDVMSKLGNAAEEIGNVTDVIKKIADKTNLLALNATIEAAGAGEAGKGFAVVAAEVKELAYQSALSADDIANRITSIQKGTNNAVDIISKVSSVITEINSSIDSIANSVQQQTVANNEISNNAGQANGVAERMVHAVGDITQSARTSAEKASGVAQNSKNIAENVGALYEDAREVNENSAVLKDTASKLKHMAERLDSMLSNFKT